MELSIEQLQAKITNLSLEITKTTDPVAKKDRSGSLQRMQDLLEHKLRIEALKNGATPYYTGSVANFTKEMKDWLTLQVLAAPADQKPNAKASVILLANHFGNYIKAIPKIGEKVGVLLQDIKRGKSGKKSTKKLQQSVPVPVAPAIEPLVGKRKARDLEENKEPAISYQSEAVSALLSSSQSSLDTQGRDQYLKMIKNGQAPYSDFSQFEREQGILIGQYHQTHPDIAPVVEGENDYPSDCEDLQWAKKKVHKELKAALGCKDPKQVAEVNKIMAIIQGYDNNAAMAIETLGKLLTEKDRRIAQLEAENKKLRAEKEEIQSMYNQISFVTLASGFKGLAPPTTLASSSVPFGMSDISSSLGPSVSAANQQQQQ